MKGLEKLYMEVHLFLLGNPAKFYNAASGRAGRAKHHQKFPDKNINYFDFPSYLILKFTFVKRYVWSN